MADKDVEQTGERGYDLGPWWAELGTWGAVALIVFGGFVAAWVSFGPPGTPEEPAYGYYQAARVIAIGLVTVGCTLLGRRRARAAAIEETCERERVPRHQPLSDVAPSEIDSDRASTDDRS